MPQAIHRNNGTRTDAFVPPLALVHRARPHIPPSSPRTARTEEIVYRVNQDYKFLFKLMFQAIDFFDRCEDCETLIDAGKMFRYLSEVAEDALEEAWEVN